jgi:membrane-associated protein
LLGRLAPVTSLPVDTAEKSRALTESLSSILNPKDLIQSFGLLGIWAIIFAETGLLVGFFFPGDSLIFLGGVAASPVATDFLNVRLPIVWLLIVTPIVAIAGAQLGYLLGARYGRRMFQRPDSKLFKQEYVDKAEAFFTRYGPAKAIVLARFTPIVRTFMNPIAGVLRVPARTFLIWNIVGGVLWTDGVLLAGYFLAKKIRDVIPPEKIDTYLLPVVVLIVLISLIPIFVEILRTRREKKRAARDQDDATQYIGRH